MTENIIEWIGNAKTVGISGHIRPDGDCIGACLALYAYLKKECPDKQVDVYLEEPLKKFAFLKYSKEVNNDYPDDRQYDVFIALDCGDAARLGEAKKYFQKAAETICIDHHISNEKFARKNLIEPDASSTCEVLYTVLEEEKIDKAVAEALYVGIIHDSGVFKYTCTSKRTMEIAGILMEKGVPFDKIIDETFYQKSYIQNQILGRCLLESIMVLDGRCIVSAISQKTLEFYGAASKDLDGVIDQLRITKGVEVAILIHEIDTQQYKVSMRANGDVDVSKIAIYFGGGGHKKAAGCTLNGSYYDVINNLTKLIEEQLNAMETEENK